MPCIFYESGKTGAFCSNVRVITRYLMLFSSLVSCDSHESSSNVK
jgi:hypothetical protein